MPDKTLTEKFISYLNSHIPWFKCDEQCLDVVLQLGYYALNDQLFEKNCPGKWTNLKVKYKNPGMEESQEDYFQQEVFLEKGVLLFGNYGTGKTDMLNMLQHYLISIQSPETFRSGIVWLYGNHFTEKGFDALKPIEKRCNWFFDELGLKDENGDYKEWANHYGTKILIGSEIIRIRYELFKYWGIKTHFTTNLTPSELKSLYGGRNFSRLVEMCNFIPLLGKDRRMDGRPNFYSKASSTVQPYQPVNQQEYDNDHSEFLRSSFERYKINKCGDYLSATHYDLLVIMGIEPCTEQEFQVGYIEKAKEKRKETIVNSTNREIRDMRVAYSMGKIPDSERSVVLVMAKKMVVVDYFNQLIEQGKELEFS